MHERQQTQQFTESKHTFQKQATPILKIPVSNPASIIQSDKINPNSLIHVDVLQLQRAIGNKAVGRLLSGIQNHSTVQLATVQRKEIPKEEEPLQTKRENNTGMSDNLKTGVESLSGIDLSDVRVHYNSSKPAEVGALAYTQGADIHVAPGQEKHLPHEAWHVVQQAQGRVRPTIQLKDIAVNDDTGLEQEAHAMGKKATADVALVLVQEKIYDHHAGPMMIQRMWTGEVEKEAEKKRAKGYDPEHYVFANKIQEKICIPLKYIKTEEVIRNLRALIAEYPLSVTKNRVFWNYFKQSGYNQNEAIGPFKEYPGPIWMWPLQSSGSILPPQEHRGKFENMKKWTEWKSSAEDTDQLNKLWELAQALARECLFLNAPPDLSTDQNAKDWLLENLESRFESYRKIYGEEGHPPIEFAKRIKSIRGIEAHLSRLMVPSQSTSEVTQEPIPKDTEEPGAFGF
jgi:hypothetical protein